jgi:hypothetical protein
MTTIHERVKELIVFRLFKSLPAHSFPEAVQQITTQLARSRWLRVKLCCGARLTYHGPPKNSDAEREDEEGNVWGMTTLGFRHGEMCNP